MYGYHGKALVVNLTDRTHRWEGIDRRALRSFIGGIGLGTYLLYRYCPPGADPLGPDNPLLFVGSPLVGTRLTTSSKFAVLTKSPLTGFIADSLSSSFLSTELKKCCGDALIIQGRAAYPTLLHIESDTVEPEGVRVYFRDATDLTGLTTGDKERRSRKGWGQPLPGGLHRPGRGGAGQVCLHQQRRRASGRAVRPRRGYGFQKPASPGPARL